MSEEATGLGLLGIERPDGELVIPKVADFTRLIEERYGLLDYASFSVLNTIILQSLKRERNCPKRLRIPIQKTLEILVADVPNPERASILEQFNTALKTPLHVQQRQERVFTDVPTESRPEWLRMSQKIESAERVVIALSQDLGQFPGGRELLGVIARQFMKSSRGGKVSMHVDILVPGTELGANVWMSLIEDLRLEFNMSAEKAIDRLLSFNRQNLRVIRVPEPWCGVTFVCVEDTATLDARGWVIGFEPHARPSLMRWPPSALDRWRQNVLARVDNFPDLLEEIAFSSIRPIA